MLDSQLVEFVTDGKTRPTQTLKVNYFLNEATKGKIKAHV